MKKTSSIGLILTSVILAGILSMPQAEAKEQTNAVPTNQVVAAAVPTNQVSVAETNAPAPVNSLLNSSLPEDIDPASPLGQLIRLVQAGVAPAVLVAYINNYPRFFELNADDIIYLTDLGVPADVITTAIQHDQKLMKEGIYGPPEAPTQTAESTTNELSNAAPTESETNAAPTHVTINYFYDTLSPYGVWVNIDGYGWCWRPTVVIYNSAWQPYCDNGHWVYTDFGWYWMSGYAWGWATFHYGRWFHDARYGWCWWPDTVWAPSWVCWRRNADYCGWAPLPPHTIYRSGVGFIYRGSTVAVGFDFGLNANAFTFVLTKNFCNPNLRHYRIALRHTRRIFDTTRSFHNIKFDNHYRSLTNPGIDRRDIVAATHKEIQPVAIRYFHGSQRYASRRERFDKDNRTLVVTHPDVTRRNKRVVPSRDRQTNPGVHNIGGRSSERGNNTGVQPPRSRQPVYPHITVPRSGNGGNRVVPKRRVTPVVPPRNGTPENRNRSSNRPNRNNAPVYQPRPGGQSNDQNSNGHTQLRRPAPRNAAPSAPFIRQPPRKNTPPQWSRPSRTSRSPSMGNGNRSKPSTRVVPPRQTPPPAASTGNSNKKSKSDDKNK